MIFRNYLQSKRRKLRQYSTLFSCEVSDFTFNLARARMEGFGGGSHHRGPTTAIATSPFHSKTLRDSFLASDIADKNTSRSGIARNSFSGLTLAAVLNNERNQSTPTNPSNANSYNHTHDNNNNNNSAIVRTLLDILQNDQALIPNSTNVSRKRTWKSFTDKLKLRRNPTTTAGSSSASNIFINELGLPPVPRSDPEVPGHSQISNRSSSLQNSLGNSFLLQQTGSLQGAAADSAGDTLIRDNRSRGLENNGGGSMRLSAALAAEREETRRRLSVELAQAGSDENFTEVGGSRNSGGEGTSGHEEEGNRGGSAGGGEPMLRMSLMDLLEQTERERQQTRIQGPIYRFEDEVVDDEEVEEDGKVVDETTGGEGVGGEVSCCVCMVRHKGAAFIPCGHTFCRMCSRELWVQRGQCPLCNNFILEVLDIF